MKATLFGMVQGRPLAWGIDTISGGNFLKQYSNSREQRHRILNHRTASSLIKKVTKMVWEEKAPKTGSFDFFANEIWMI